MLAVHQIETAGVKWSFKASREGSWFDASDELKLLLDLPYKTIYWPLQHCLVRWHY